MTEQKLEKMKARLEAQHSRHEGFGRSLSVPRWAELLGLHRKAVWRYIKKGLTIEQIFELRGVQPPKTE